MKVCRNTGETLLTDCGQTDCFYFNKKRQFNCVNGDWDTNKPEDLAKMMGQPANDMKRLTKDAETKIAVWGSILRSIDTLPRVDFSLYIKTVYRYCNDVAINMSVDPDTFIVSPMHYVKPFMWVSIVRKWHNDLQVSEIASATNIDVWRQLTNLNLL